MGSRWSNRGRKQTHKSQGKKQIIARRLFFLLFVVVVHFRIQQLLSRFYTYRGVYVYQQSLSTVGTGSIFVCMGYYRKFCSSSVMLVVVGVFLRRMLRCWRWSNSQGYLPSQSPGLLPPAAGTSSRYVHQSSTHTSQHKYTHFIAQIVSLQMYHHWVVVDITVSHVVHCTIH